ncbi:hypothetical protein PMIN06_009698 [Paraphaeosphaeria minitans]|uniref:Serine/threonine-protein phosphatase 2A activator n=1 Tax=Paraphaeosphaeria minitans TaxID=565426 RepID=A0A9P6KJM5_9PLEO|nr:serine threonine-protein phosphatase 2a activator 1 [Paraphaeosphaeria minitans]
MQGNQTSTPLPSRALEPLDRSASHRFKVPVKCINDGDHVSFFLSSKAYTDIMTFIFQLNVAMLPRTTEKETSGVASAREWTLQDPDVPFPPIVQNLAKLLEVLSRTIDEAPPDPGPRRFGNVSFRKWSDLVGERVPDLLDQYLPAEALESFKDPSEGDITAKQEIETYLIGSFGSSQRLDYGSGHELSFLAFLGCLWKLGAFPLGTDGATERAVVLGVFEPYLRLIRRLILTYTLEPAGSHGVWGLDDHSFLPYIFGSAQFSPAISSPDEFKTEGSLPSAPDPGDVAKATAVERERNRNMYFSAIGFIYDVKRGPFWEHSPILFDVSGVKAGWAKINKGMIKMYNAEVLSKFPVVQHFPFGSLFVWERDPLANKIQASVGTSSQPESTPQSAMRDPLGDANLQTTKMPSIGTAAPWASSRIPPRAQGPGVPAGPNQPTRAPWAPSTSLPPSGGTTTAPWTRPGAAASSTTRGTVPSQWADKERQN